MRDIFSALELGEINSGVWSADGGWSNDSSGPLIDSINPTTGEIASEDDPERRMSSGRGYRASPGSMQCDGEPAQRVHGTAGNQVL